MHQLTIMENKFTTFRRTNVELSKRRSVKRRRLQEGGNMSFEEGQDLQT
jgi:hypothetical protein